MRSHDICLGPEIRKIKISELSSKSCCIWSYDISYKVEPRRLQQAWDHENRFQSKVVPARWDKFLYLETEV